MATKSQEILLKGNTTNASAVPSSLKVREIAINALDRSLFTNDGNSIVKLYTGTTKWFDVNGNANNALKADSVAWANITNKPTTFTPSAHTHTASEVSGLPTNLSAFTNDVGYLTSITKSMVEGVLTGDITSHTHTYLPLSGGTLTGLVTFANKEISLSGLFLSYTDKALRVRTQSGNSYFGMMNDYACHIYTDAGLFYMNKPLHVDNGNVLIGTETNTGYKLTVYGSANISGDLAGVDNITASGKATIQGDIISGGEVAAVVGEGTPAGVTDYSALTGKPQINGVTLVSGNNTLAALGIQAAGDYATNSGVTTLLADYAKKTFISNNYVGKSAFNTHTADSIIHITSAERVAWNAKWDYDENTIKAVKVTAASSADSVAWSGITGKPSTFTPTSHTHTANDVSGLPTSLKNPYALTFGSKAYDGSAAATITASDLGALTSITKSMVEGVLTGDITSHTHSYLPLSGGTLTSANPPLYINRINGFSSILYQVDGATVGILGFNQNGVLITRPNYQSNANYYNIIHAGNYNSYAPTLTGTGASGTWGISISGNAATATKLATARKIWGQSFDGTSNINGDITMNTASGYYSKISSSTSGLAIESWQQGIGFLPIRLNPNGGNILIGTTTDNGYKLQVSGSERVYGDLIVDGEVSALVA